MAKNSEKIALCWLRRDLRLHDNTALLSALKSGLRVLPLFIFDTEILDNLSDKRDRRVEFIHSALAELHEELRKIGSTLLIRHGSPLEVWKNLLEELTIAEVFCNRDYEPYARKRDFAVKELLAEKSIPFRTFKDHVIFEMSEICKDDGSPYTIFTPYSKRWKQKFSAEYHANSDTVSNFATNFLPSEAVNFPSLSEIGFEASGIDFPSKSLRESLIRTYNVTRDTPAIDGTSRLGVHVRFGTISVREAVEKAAQWNETWLNELIWREFFMQILWNFPRVVGHSFRAEYDNIQWRNNEEEFERWKNGQTGFGIVDAGMRELNETGFMHNRVRMITASFLVKDLLIDWRWGEAYFAEKLLDFDLSANNGNWQWAAGTGCDAAPYFRIFNPDSQTKKFDPDYAYIRRWVPDFGTPRYPAPMIEHSVARERTLAAFRNALGK